MTILSHVAMLVSLVDSSVCRPAPDASAAKLLSRAAAVTGLSGAGRLVLHAHAFDVTNDGFESDRMYPPFLLGVRNVDQWFDPASGVERVATRTTIGGYENPGPTVIGSAAASYGVRDTTLVPSEQVHGSMYTTRPLTVWAALLDWQASNDVQVVGRCEYRDYPRLVLRRKGTNGTEELFLDPKSGYPVKLDRTEPHYLWGQSHVEYVYSTWQRVGNAHLPGVTFRVEDGEPIVTRTFGATGLMSRDSAPSLTIPTSSKPMGTPVAAFLAQSAPDTVRVSATTFILHNPGYAETVTLARDTVFVFDATQGDERVHQDSLWIGKLFPGKHPLVVVVTDLAWPHVAGVRGWVARGATIVSHRASRAFLQRVVARRWTLHPDLLERRRATAVMHFRAVDDTLRLAGGDVLLFAIDGVASEGALAAFVRPDHFLWGSDYIQDVTAPTQYVDEVVAAVHRVGVAPERVAAEHAPLTAWQRVMALAEAAPH